MLTHIASSPVINDPWNHIVVENVFSPNEWDDIQTTAKLLNSDILSGIIRIDYNDSTVIPKSTIDILTNFADNLLKSYKEILSALGNYDESATYNVIGHWAITKNRAYKIHYDAIQKAMTFIVYIDPNQAIGTILYKKTDEIRFHSQIKWIPNHGLIFSPIEDVTWHSYLHFGDDRRITLNFYLHKNE
jgi:hypothetical protein